MPYRKKSETGFLNAAIACIKGIAASSALKHAGYPESTCLHSSKRALESREMKAAFRRIGLVLAQDLNGPDYAETLAFLQDEKSSPQEVRETARRLYGRYEQKSDRRDNPSEVIEGLPEISKLLLWNDPPEQQGNGKSRKSAPAQKGEKSKGSDGEVVLSLVKVLGEEIETVTWDELGARAKELIRQELWNPPKDGRTRLMLYRLALEGAREIGAASNPEVHLHATLPPVVQRMLEQKMREIIDNQSSKAIDAEIVTATAETQETACEVLEAPNQPDTAPDVTIPNDTLRKQVVTGTGFIRSMHEFLGVE